MQMTITIGVVSLLITLVTLVVKISMDYSKIKATIEQQGEKLKAHDSMLKEQDVKIDSLKDAVTELVVTVKYMTKDFNKQFEEIKRRLPSV
jgi:peptidoglycan hydrolase CwlO-like protein